MRCLSLHNLWRPRRPVARIESVPICGYHAHEQTQLSCASFWQLPAGRCPRHHFLMLQRPPPSRHFLTPRRHSLSSGTRYAYATLLLCRFRCHFLAFWSCGSLGHSHPSQRHPEPVRFLTNDDDHICVHHTVIILVRRPLYRTSRLRAAFSHTPA
jgi:hypothetical protein